MRGCAVQKARGRAYGRHMTALGITLAFAGPAQAIVANPPPRICTAYSSADAVVAGIVSRERLNKEWVTWRIKVDRRYKGKVPASFTLFSENASARATPDEGKRNILFVHRRGNRLTAKGSDPNVSGAEAQQIIGEVESLAAAKPGKTGSVAGLVAAEDGSTRPGWRVQLREQRTGATRSVNAGGDGRFAVDLQPGEWAAKVVNPGWTSRDSVYGYNLSDSFTLTAGGCADLRLEPTQR